MVNVRVLLMTGALATAASVGALAQTDSSSRIMVAHYAAAAATTRVAPAASPLSYASIRAGAMVTPRGAGLVGVDFAVPSISTGSGWHARVDADVIFKANFGGIDTIVPVTVDLLTYSPGAIGSHGIYYGGGLGAVLGGPAKFDGKLVLGTELTSRLGAEVNVHFTEHDTLVTLLARIHL